MGLGREVGAEQGRDVEGVGAEVGHELGAGGGEAPVFVMRYPNRV